jgi:hypothetical protein
MLVIPTSLFRRTELAVAASSMVSCKTLQPFVIIMDKRSGQEGQQDLVAFAGSHVVAFCGLECTEKLETPLGQSYCRHS